MGGRQSGRLEREVVCSALFSEDKRERPTQGTHDRHRTARARERERERGESRLEASSHAQRTGRRTAQTLSKDKDEPRVRLPLQAFAYWRLWRGKVLLASPLRGRNLPGVLH